MLNTNPQALIERKQESIRSLYDKYASMLLGYIFEVVKDRKLAEEYLVQLFCDLSQQFDEINWEEGNGWCQLQRFVKGRLPIIAGTAKDCEDVVSEPLTNGFRNKYLDLLNDFQKKVFCDIYYHGKEIDVISKELNKEEDLIRQALKEAFTIMKKSSAI